MASISLIPTTRVSDLFVREQLLSQTRSAQLALFRTQRAISTGQRISVPSEDAPAALRAISVQSLLERKTQVQANLRTNQTFLSATDSALTEVSSQLANIRGTALSVVGTTSTPEQRKAVALEVQRALQQLVDTANQHFRGRYLFAGSETSLRPFSQDPAGVLYSGNEGALESFSDIDVLFETNLTGHDVFGALSPPVKGGKDLNPILAPETKLDLLRGGQGIKSGSIRISDGQKSSIVDISSAKNIGDVARLIESHPPIGRAVSARVTTTGLSISLDSAGGGNLSITEVGQGTTAAELGIFLPNGTGTGPIVGSDLNPRLSGLTSLKDILGTRAKAFVPLVSDKNPVIIEAKSQGANFNGVKIHFVDDGSLQAGDGLAPGNEQAVFTKTPIKAVASLVLAGNSNDLILTASTGGETFNNVAVNIVNGGNIGNTASVAYDSVNKKLTLTVDDSNETTVDAVIDAINIEGTFSAARDASAETNASGGVIETLSAGNNVANTRNSGANANSLVVRLATGKSSADQVIAAINAEGTFTARFERPQTQNEGELAAFDGFLKPSIEETTSGGSGTFLDQTSGIQISNAGKSVNLDLSTLNTVEDLLNALNGSGTGVLAEISADGSGISIRSRHGGSELRIGENGGTSAEQLGIRTFRADTLLSELNFGRGVHTVPGDDFTIRRRDGVEIGIDINGANTVQDVLNRINQHPQNQSGVPIVARIAKFGNGIELLADGPAGQQILQVSSVLGSEAPQDLGLIPVGGTTSGPPVEGIKSSGNIVSAGGNNDLTISAAESGTRLNGAKIQFVDDDQLQAAPGLAAGNERVEWSEGAVAARTALTLPGSDNDLILLAAETGSKWNNIAVDIVDGGNLGNTAGAVFNPVTKRLTISIDDTGESTADAIMSAINAEGTFVASRDFSVENHLTNGTVDISAAGTDLANTGNSGGDPKTLFVFVEAGASTANQIISAVDAQGMFHATLAETDANNDGSGPIEVAAIGTVDGGTADILTGADVNPVEVKGVFNALFRLNQALLTGNDREIERAIALMDDGQIQVNFARADLGARMQGLDVLNSRLDSEDIELRSTLSAEIDTDLAAAISQLAGQQASLQASLQTTAQIYKLSLLDFL